MTMEAIQKEGAIIQRLAAPYTPQHNWSNKGKIRNIVEMARTSKYSNEDVDFPSSMWTEFLCADSYFLRLGIKQH